MISDKFKLAICFMSMDESISKRQLIDLKLENSEFEVELYFRSDRNEIQYQTFSQMINEAIDDTESEFMIFMNPKVVANIDDIRFIVGKLQDGCCLSSLFGLAFFGMSKELVRNVGMLDESFLHSEYEDDDFLVRLRIFGKKVYWGQDWSKYNYHQSYCTPYRGSSLTTFWNKWWLKDNTIYNNNLNKHKKISKRHRISNPHIFNEWKNFQYSWGEGHIYEKVMSYKIQETNLQKKIIDSNLSIFIKYDKNYFFIDFNSNVDTAISCNIYRTNNKGRTPIVSRLVYSNTWHQFPIDYDRVELRIYHDGTLVYINEIEYIDFRINLSLPSHVLL